MLRGYVVNGYTNALDGYLRTGTNASRMVWCGPRQGDFASLLHIAVQAGQLASARLLIDRGANPNLEDSHGRAPLLWVVGLTENHVRAETRERILRLLLNKGANPDLQDADGQTALMWACSFGQAEFTRQLVQSGAAVSIKDTNGNTALHLAATPEVATLLLNAGANLNQMNRNNETPLATALRDGRPSVLSVLTNFHKGELP
jgi:ankyrin repeat protein